MSTARCTRKPPRRAIWNFFFKPPTTTTSPKVPPDLFLPFSPLQTFPKGGTPLRGRGVNLSYKGSHSFEGSLNFSCNLIPARLAACISPRGASPRYNLWRIIAGGLRCTPAGLLFLYSAAIIKGPRSQMYMVRESPINSGQMGVTVTPRHQFKIIKPLN